MSHSRMFDESYDAWIDAIEEEDRRVMDNDLSFQQKVLEEIEKAGLEDQRIAAVAAFHRITWRKR